MSPSSSYPTLKIYGVVPGTGDTESEDGRARPAFVQAIQEGICPHCGHGLTEVFHKGRWYATCEKDLYGAYRVEGAYGA